MKLKPNVTPELILLSVLHSYSMSYNDIQSKCRKGLRPIARYTYYWLCKKYTNLTLAEMAKAFTQDHASALHGIKTINGYLDVSDRRYKPYINNAELILLDKSNKQNEIQKYSHKNKKNSTPRVLLHKGLSLNSARPGRAKIGLPCLPGGNRAVPLAPYFRKSHNTLSPITG